MLINAMNGKISSNSNTVYTLQALRGMAIALVVLFHTTQLCAEYYHVVPLNGVFLFGFSGIHLFFVLSGFIIFTVHYNDINRPSQLINYLKKRFIRIYPTYWITLTFFSVWLFFQGTITPHDIYASISLVEMPWHCVNPVSWTLTFEVAFYLIFASLIVNRRLGVVILCCWVIALAAAYLFAISPPFILRHLTHKYIVLFVIGLAAAYGVVQWKQRISTLNQHVVHGLFTIGLFLFVITAYLILVYSIQDWDLWTITLGFGIASGLLMTAALSPVLEQFFQSRTLLTTLGDASYSIYLVHYLVIKALIYEVNLYIPTAHPITITLIFVVVAVTVTWIGWLQYHFIERPLLQRMRRRVSPLLITPTILPVKAYQ